MECFLKQMDTIDYRFPVNETVMTPPRPEHGNGFIDLLAVLLFLLKINTYIKTVAENSITYAAFTLACDGLGFLFAYIGPYLNRKGCRLLCSSAPLCLLLDKPKRGARPSCRCGNICLARALTLKNFVDLNLRDSWLKDYHIDVHVHCRL